MTVMFRHPSPSKVFLHLHETLDRASFPHIESGALHGMGETGFEAVTFGVRGQRSCFRECLCRFRESRAVSVQFLLLRGALTNHVDDQAPFQRTDRPTRPPTRLFQSFLPWSEVTGAAAASAVHDSGGLAWTSSVAAADTAL